MKFRRYDGINLLKPQFGINSSLKPNWGNKDIFSCFSCFEKRSTKLSNK